MLSTLGVIIGVGAMVAVLSVGDGIEVAMRAQISQTTDLQSVSIQPKVYENVNGQMFPVRDPMTFAPSDVAALAAIEGVDGASILLGGPGEARTVDTGSRRMATVMAELSIPDSSGARALEAGRTLRPNEAAADTSLVVLSHDLARSLDPDSNARRLVGRTILIEEHRAEVIGVLAPRPDGATPIILSRPGRGDFRVLASLGFAQRALPRQRQSLPTLTAHAAKVEQTDAVKRGIETWLATRDTGWARRASVTTSERRLEQATQGVLMFKLFMGALTGISLLVGGIGIMNVLLSSVTERTREIGIRKATGAGEGDIRLQFLAESVAISSAGSAIGLVLGVSAAFGITAMIRHFSRAPFLRASFSLSTLLVAIIAAVFVGLVFGTYPARRAARLSPIDAIRHE